jgi:sulfur transfer complex TusBCD TusB component (DsrH family)
VKRILHILKDPNNKKPFDLIQRQMRAQDPTEVRLVLTQEAVKLRLDFHVAVYVLDEDLRERGLSSPYPKIDYSGLLDLIFDSESVISW